MSPGHENRRLGQESGRAGHPHGHSPVLVSHRRVRISHSGVLHGHSGVRIGRLARGFVLLLAVAGSFLANSTWLPGSAESSFRLIAPAHAHKYSGMKVREILKLKKGSIKQAPLEPGSPSWDDILDLAWEQIEEGAKAGKPGFRTFHKLLTNVRFDK